MKTAQNNLNVLFALTALLVTQLVCVPPAKAESSLLIQLNEQLNKEANQVKDNLTQLKTPSPHQKSAIEWAKKVRSLPKDSKDYAYARAQYAHAVASDLEQKFATVSQIEQASSAMTDTIDRLVDAHARTGQGNQSYFGKQDSVEEIQAKARQLKNLNRMFVSLINADPLMRNSKLGQAYKVYQLHVQNTRLQASINREQGIGSLQRLRASSESITFLARTYLNGLQYQANAIQIVSIGGEANMVNKQAETVLADAFDALNPDGQSMQDMQMMLGSIEDTQSTPYSVTANPGLSDEIDAIANRLIAEKQ